METASFDPLVEWTDFGMVRQHLRIARSPALIVLFAASRDLLIGLATMLDSSGCSSAAIRRRKLSRLFEAGLIAVGDTGHSDEIGVPMENLSRDTACHVIYFPAACLVHVPGLKLVEGRHRVRLASLSHSIEL